MNYQMLFSLGAKGLKKTKIRIKVYFPKQGFLSVVARWDRVFSISWRFRFRRLSKLEWSPSQASPVALIPFKYCSRCSRSVLQACNFCRVLCNIQLSVRPFLQSARVLLRPLGILSKARFNEIAHCTNYHCSWENNVRGICADCSPN